MAKVYVVTDGDYSDYHIEAIFSTREKAVEFCGGERNADSITEFDLDDDGGRCFRVFYVVRINFDDGAMSTPYSYTEITRRSFDPRALVKVDVYVASERCRSVDFPGATAWANVRSPVSPEHARKVAAETRQAWLRKVAQMGHAGAVEGAVTP